MLTDLNHKISFQSVWIWFYMNGVLENFYDYVWQGIRSAPRPTSARAGGAASPQLRQYSAGSGRNSRPQSARVMGKPEHSDANSPTPGENSSGDAGADAEITVALPVEMGNVKGEWKCLLAWYITTYSIDFCVKRKVCCLNSTFVFRWNSCLEVEIHLNTFLL